MLIFNRKLRAGLSLSTEEYAHVAIGGMLRRWMHNEKVELGAHLKRRLQEDLFIFTKCRLNFSHLNPALLRVYADPDNHGHILMRPAVNMPLTTWHDLANQVGGATYKVP